MRLLGYPQYSIAIAQLENAPDFENHPYGTSRERPLPCLLTRPSSWLSTRSVVERVVMPSTPPYCPILHAKATMFNHSFHLIGI
jgi:hypothetical protein